MNNSGGQRIRPDDPQREIFNIVEIKTNKNGKEKK